MSEQYLETPIHENVRKPVAEAQGKALAQRLAVFRTSRRVKPFRFWWL
ncbi:MAG TPA: hypothetical protein PL051_00130 [Candidatus Saccharibacteria bacterium]|nr:hypothetical protein [Candidatus Saccharibacteria bacterium]